MHGYSHGQPQVPTEISEDQVAYNESVQQCLQALVKGRNEAKTAQEFEEAKIVYLDRVFFFRDIFGVKESTSLIV